MRRKVSFNGLATLLMSLTCEEQTALLDYPDELKKLVQELVTRREKNVFFIPISDKDAPEKFSLVAIKWRKLAAEMGYSGPILWKIKEGYCFLDSIKAGPCHENFNYLKYAKRCIDPSLTRKSLVFWIPRIIQECKGQNEEQQSAFLEKLRIRLELPSHHLTSFGSLALLSGLIFAHFKRTGERAPLKKRRLDPNGLRLTDAKALSNG